MESKDFKNWMEDLDATDPAKWNDATKYYTAGQISTLHRKGLITYDEYSKLQDRIPLTLEEWQKVKFHV